VGLNYPNNPEFAYFLKKHNFSKLYTAQTAALYQNETILAIILEQNSDDIPTLKFICLKMNPITVFFVKQCRPLRDKKRVAFRGRTKYCSPYFLLIFKLRFIAALLS